jgi:hypothetical protein
MISNLGAFCRSSWQILSLPEKKGLYKIIFLQHHNFMANAVQRWQLYAALKFVTPAAINQKAG